VEEVQGHDPGGLRSQELFPGRAGSAWRRVDTGLFQDRRHGGWRDWVAEATQLAVALTGCNLHKPSADFSHCNAEDGHGLVCFVRAEIQR
jgi:hypothetical protein